ncbi:conserved hypothetical protein [Ricinus communis]|uniref:Uncharacterized protein n=1 Tax=Ricinus communis TaxID=3988 RepID=B9R6R1_RICCO|nr:conserved hypothetical protein [Ricinus communis]
MGNQTLPSLSLSFFLVYLFFFMRNRSPSAATYLDREEAVFEKSRASLFLGSRKLIFIGRNSWQNLTNGVLQAEALCLESGQISLFLTTADCAVGLPETFNKFPSFKTSMKFHIFRKLRLVFSQMKAPSAHSQCKYYAVNKSDEIATNSSLVCTTEKRRGNVHKGDIRNVFIY